VNERLCWTFGVGSVFSSGILINTASVTNQPNGHDIRMRFVHDSVIPNAQLVKPFEVSLEWLGIQGIRVLEKSFQTL
jgi:hypothetical protein